MNMSKEELIDDIITAHSNYKNLIVKKSSIVSEIIKLQTEYDLYCEGLEDNDLTNKKNENAKAILIVEVEIEKLEIELAKIKGAVEIEYRLTNKTTDAQTKAFVDSHTDVVGIKKSLVDKNFELKSLKIQNKLDSGDSTSSEDRCVDSKEQSLKDDISKLQDELSGIQDEIKIAKHLYLSQTLVSNLV